MKKYRTSSFVQLKISSMLRSFCWKCPGHLTPLIRLLSARLCNHFDFRGQVLKWFESYLHIRKQFVMIDSVIWFQRPSIWCSTEISPWTDPVLFVHLPFRQYCETSWSEFHLYAEGTQLYFAFRPITAKQHSSLAGLYLFCFQFVQREY